jgi:hypothetical protein
MKEAEEGETNDVILCDWKHIFADFAVMYYATYFRL